MAGLPKSHQGAIAFHLDAIKACFNDSHVTLVIRFPWLQDQGMDGDSVITDDPDLLEVISVVEKRIIEQKLPQIKKDAAAKGDAP